MKAALCKALGTPLVVETIDLPAPSAGEVQIAVHACGVNFPDLLMVNGLYQRKPNLPFSPGLEVAGTVAGVGAGVTHVKPGDRVLGIVEQGGFAEAVNAPAPMVLPIPDSMTYVTAAAFPITYGTSHIALNDRAKLRAGETLLVGGAAGGVGLTAVELGKLMGARVIAAASTPEKLALAQQYGADAVINYSTEDTRARVLELTDGKGADVIYDPVGGEFFEAGIRAINWKGRLLVIGFAAGRIPEVAINRLLLRNCSLVGVYWGAYAANEPATMRDSFQTLLAWQREGKLKPHIAQTLPLEAASQALDMLAQRRVLGKLVIEMVA